MLVIKLVNNVGWSIKLVIKLVNKVVGYKVG